MRAAKPPAQPEGGDKMTIEELIKIIGNVGFPIAVALYLLIVFGAKLDRLAESVDNLAKFIEGLGKK